MTTGLCVTPRLRASIHPKPSKVIESEMRDNRQDFRSVQFVKWIRSSISPDVVLASSTIIQTAGSICCHGHTKT
jgi:hypothetical protein